jgi:hypothetical protein
LALFREDVIMFSTSNNSNIILSSPQFPADVEGHISSQHQRMSFPSRVVGFHSRGVGCECSGSSTSCSLVVGELKSSLTCLVEAAERKCDMVVPAGKVIRLRPLEGDDLEYRRNASFRDWRAEDLIYHGGPPEYGRPPMRSSEPIPIPRSRNNSYEYRLHSGAMAF